MLRLNAFMELKFTSIGRLFQTLITLSQKKVQRIPVLCGLKTIPLLSHFLATPMATQQEYTFSVSLRGRKLGRSSAVNDVCLNTSHYCDQ